MIVYIVGLSGYSWPDRSGKVAETMTITHNNVMYDGSLMSTEECPVKIVAGIDQLYPIGTVCNINLNTEGQNHTIFLRAEIRLEADWVGP